MLETVRPSPADAPVPVGMAQPAGGGALLPQGLAPCPLTQPGSAPARGDASVTGARCPQAVLGLTDSTHPRNPGLLCPGAPPHHTSLAPTALSVGPPFKRSRWDGLGTNPLVLTISGKPLPTDFQTCSISCLQNCLVTPGDSWDGTLELCFVGFHKANGLGNTTGPFEVTVSLRSKSGFLTVWVGGLELVQVGGLGLGCDHSRRGPLSQPPASARCEGALSIGDSSELG